MKDIDVAWSAGLIEGEGCLAKTSVSSFIIQVHMTDLDVLETLRSIWGGNIYDAPRIEEHHKKSWVWNLSGKKAANMLELLLPYLGQRRSLKAIELLDNYNAPRNARAQRKEKARLLRSQGMSYRDIAAELGIGISTVRDDIKEYRS